MSFPSYKVYQFKSTIRWLLVYLIKLNYYYLISESFNHPQKKTQTIFISSFPQLDLGKHWFAFSLYVFIFRVRPGAMYPSSIPYLLLNNIYFYGEALEFPIHQLIHI